MRPVAVTPEVQLRVIVQVAYEVGARAARALGVAREFQPLLSIALRVLYALPAPEGGTKLLGVSEGEAPCSLRARHRALRRHREALRAFFHIPGVREFWRVLRALGQRAADALAILEAAHA